MNKKLRTVKAVQCYLGVREFGQYTDMKEFTNTYGKPHKPASSDTISRLIKAKLGMAVIKMNFYKACSC